MAEPDLTELVTIRSEFGEIRDVARGSLPGFINYGWVVLKSDGSVNPNPATPSKKD